MGVTLDTQRKMVPTGGFDLSRKSGNVKIVLDIDCHGVKHGVSPV
jgi:hypothetical protein